MRLIGRPGRPLVVALMLLVGCASPPGSDPVSVLPSPSAHPTPETEPTQTPIGQPLQYGCRPGLARCEDLAPDTYVTAGQYAFLTGLTVTVPEGWSSGEQDAGEFELHLKEDVGRYRELLFWRDMVPWVDGRPAPQLGTSADELASYLLSDPRLSTVEGEPRTFDRYQADGSIAGSVTARSVTVMIAADAPKEVPECPGSACLDFLGDPYHWGTDHGVGILRGFVPGEAELRDLTAAGILVDGSECPCGNVAMLYIAQLGDANTVIAAIATFGPDDPEALTAALTAWENEVEPILRTLVLPWGIAAN